MSDAAENLDAGAAAAAAADGEQGAAGDATENVGAPSRPSIEKFESWEQLEAGYKELESYRGNSVRIPSQEAGAEDWKQFDESLSKVPGVVRLPGDDDQDGWNNFYGRLGRPEDPAGYNLQGPEGLQIPGEEVAGFAQAAHQHNLTRDQAQGVYNALATDLANSQQEQLNYQKQAVERLRGEWGKTFDHKIGMARTAATMLNDKLPGIKDYMDSIDPAAGVFDVNSVKMLSLMAELMGETGAIDQGRPAGWLAPEEAMLQATEIRDNPDHPYNNEMDPAHEAAKTKMKELYKMAYSK